MQELGAVFRPQLVDFAEDHQPTGVGRLELRGQIAVFHAAQPKIGLWMQAQRPVGKLTRREVAALASGMAQQRLRRPDNAPPPEVAHRGDHRWRIVAAHVEPERDGAVEGEVRQQALAEAVDGEDVGAVQIAHRGLQAARCVSRDAKLPPALRQPRRLVVARCRTVAGDGIVRLAQSLPQPVAKLARGGNREGHHEQSFHRLGALGDRARRQGGEGIRLAGSGARFDQQVVAERHVEGRGLGFADGAHAIAAANGPSSSSAKVSNASSPSGLSGKAKRLYESCPSA